MEERAGPGHPENIRFLLFFLCHLSAVAFLSFPSPLFCFKNSLADQREGEWEAPDGGRAPRSRGGMPGGDRIRLFVKSHRSSLGQQDKYTRLRTAFISSLLRLFLWLGSGLLSLVLDRSIDNF